MGGGEFFRVVVMVGVVVSVSGEVGSLLGTRVVAVDDKYCWNGGVGIGGCCVVVSLIIAVEVVLVVTGGGGVGSGGVCGRW